MPATPVALLRSPSNILGKGMKPFISVAISLSTTIVLQQG